MEGLVRLDVADQVAGPGRGDDGLGGRPQRLQLLPGRGTGQPRHHRDLDQCPDLCEGVQVGLGQLGDAEPLVPHHFHEPFLGQVEHRLAHRGGRHPEPGRQDRGGVDDSGPQLPGHQGRAQRVGHLLAQRVVAAEPGAGSASGRCPARSSPRPPRIFSACSDVPTLPPGQSRNPAGTDRRVEEVLGGAGEPGATGDRWARPAGGRPPRSPPPGGR